ncbi:MAG: hypothetical protein KKD18_01015 [Nanoarchaeota archaeon]|nr:hypothetical protein [Nanoarchaeota archaeon]
MSWFSNLFEGFNPRGVQPMCVENSVYAALTYAMEKKVPVRVVISCFTDKPNTDHAQAQAQIDGVWKWLVITPHIRIAEGDEDKFGPDYGIKEHYKFLSLKELMAELDGKGFLDNKGAKDDITTE